jgi:glyoxylase-like metal-dependent hydrolase (beta-lactamase superfamily II)
MQHKSSVVVDYPFPEIPAPGETVEVAPGIHWVRLPLPFVLDHVNVYLLEDGDGWTVVDCGLNKDGVKAIWESVFARLLGGKPVRRVIVTHFHPDHMGLCRWLIEKFDAELWMSQAEWLWSHFAFEARERNMESMLTFWRSHGMSVETTDALRGRGNFYSQNVGRPPIVYRRLTAGDAIEIGGRVWQVIIGEGHAPEHVCLACSDDALLLSGDQVLPRITTNISVQYTQPHADPLRLFLAANARFSGLPERTLTLCAHDRPFLNLHQRLEQLRDHHRVRLDDAWAACTVPKHAVDMLPVLFSRPLDLHQQSFAIGESIAHLHCLFYEGRLERLLGDDGVYRFLRVD